MRWAALLILAGCSFSGSPGSDGTLPADGRVPDGNPGDGPQSKGRRIVLTISGAQVTEPLTDFPVYVDLTAAELKTMLSTSAMSFRRRVGSAVESLPYELVSFDPAQGRLRAFVLLPSVSSGADTAFELQYGDASVAAAANAPEVWRNHFLAVFHLEGITAPIVDSRRPGSPGTPTALTVGSSSNAQLGKGVDFGDNNAAFITFPNPITGSGPSTISAWVSHRNTNSKDALVALGTGQNQQARWLHAEFNNNEIGLGLFNDDWLNTATTVRMMGWRLLHWTYQDQESYLFRDGAKLNATPFAHSNPAATAGSGAWLGNVKTAGFDTNAALNGVLDEVRISDVARSEGWIAAEYANQRGSSTFVTAGGPQGIP